MRVFKVYIWVCGYMYVYMCFFVCEREREGVWVGVKTIDKLFAHGIQV
jgi:hypothetical protein